MGRRMKRRWGREKKETGNRSGREREREREREIANARTCDRASHDTADLEDISY